MMEKINKKGFTLLEMVLVIAIIMIISIIVYFNAAAYLSRASSATASMESHIRTISEVTSEIDERLAKP